MFTAILSAIPVWVFPLLFGLVWLGHRASRERRVSPWLVYALPMLGLLTLSRAQGLAMAEQALTALVLTYAAGAIWGYRMQPRWTIRRDTRHVHLRGEWVTMATILALFGVNFATGMAQGIAPAITATGGFALAFGAVAGLPSGSLLGRAISVARTPASA